METLIDALSTNGAGEWTADAGISLELCQWPEYASGDRAASLMIRFPANGSGKKVGKVLASPLDTSAAEELVITLTSLRAPTGCIRRASDARYAVDVVDSGHVTTRFYVPCHGSAVQAEMPSLGINSIREFWIVCLHNEADQLIASNFLAVKDELPLDLLKAVKASIEARRDELYGIGVRIGKATFSAGDLEVTIVTDWDWVERYAVLRFVGDGVDEVHQANNAEGNVVSLTRLYDGQSMVGAATEADVYLTMPVEVGRYDLEVLLPGIALWYDGPVPEPATSRLTEEVRCAVGQDLCLKRDGLLVKWRITMDHEARSPELIAWMTAAIRAFFARGYVWAHGKRFWFEWTEPAAPVEPDAAYDVIPKTSYTIEISVREESWSKIRTVRAEPATVEASPS